jgi:N-acetylneuraminate synthase
MKTIVILEMANNHMGSIAHAKKIIKKYNYIIPEFTNKIDFVLKFQYRDRETFIHKNYKNSEDKYIKRFQSTFFSDKEWQKLIKFSKQYFRLACTPFDEVSVDKVFKEKFDYLKIGSCSVTDWPLIEYIYEKYKKKKKKIIASLGGLNEADIIKVTSFFLNRKVDISFLYCVAKYPSHSNELNLSFFNYLKKKYGEKIIGFSSHEDPEINISPAVAYGAGVRIFEKHVGLETKKIKLNKYTVSPDKLKIWLTNLCDAIEIWGSIDFRNKNLKKENMQLRLFKRGIYLNKNIKSGKNIIKSDLYFAFPSIKNQLTANNFQKFTSITNKKNLIKDSPLLFNEVKIIDNRSPVTKIRGKIRGLLNMAKITLPINPKLEISHHYGLKNFYKYGTTIINVINHNYCKKLIIMLPGQKHPPQFHKIKIESFFILYGSIDFVLDKKKYHLKTGDLKTINRKQVHEFSSKKGAVIEELSTEHNKVDSYYLDKRIDKNKNRKSLIYL